MFKLMDIGFGNFVLVSSVVSIINYPSAPMKKLKWNARETGKLIDATEGRKTRSLIVTESNHIIQSSVHARTLVERLTNMEK